MKKEIAAGKTSEEEFFSALNGARWSLPYSFLSEHGDLDSYDNNH